MPGSGTIFQSQNTNSAVGSVLLSVTSTSSASAGTGTPVVFNTLVYDNTSSFSSNTTFTAPKAGKYHVSASIYSGALNYDIQIYKNGSALYQGNDGTAASLSTISATVSLAVNDTIDIRPGQTITMAAAALNTYLMIELVG